jgi:hypothetical protein
LKLLLLNAFLAHWLKKYANYPLGTEHIKSVRLMKGKNGIHLDNKDQALFEHCFSSGNKLVAELCILLVLDVDHIEEAQAHCAHMRRCDTSPTDLEYVVRVLYSARLVLFWLKLICRTSNMAQHLNILLL